MSYIVLARKWRPQTFEEVIGQGHVTRTLMNALLKDRIAHAYIFAGPRGVGKTTTARLLAKAVNCTQRQGASPCNQCDICRSITEGRSMDVVEIDGASNRGIDEIRNLRENIRFAPAEGRYKIYIIDEVHMLSKDAFNALLKTLEEPPAHAIFVFATTEVHKVPPTILSRCQRFDFKRIPTREIAAQLAQICQQENIQIEPESLMLIARKAEGSMRDAQSILDQMISYTDGVITVQSVQESLGLIQEELYFEFTELMRQQDDRAILNYARTIFHSGHDLMDYLYGLENHFRNLLLARAGQGGELIDTSDHFRGKYLELAEQFQEADLIHYIDLLVQHENLLKFSPNPELVLELLLLKLAHKPRVDELSELLELLKRGDFSGGQAVPTRRSGVPSASGGQTSVSSPSGSPSSARVKEPPNPFAGLLGKRPAARPEPDVRPASQAQAEASAISFQELQRRWPDFLDQLMTTRPTLATFLQEGVLHSLKGTVLEIGFDVRNRFHREHVQQNKGSIETALRAHLGASVHIRCVELDFQQLGIEKPVHSPEEILEDLRKKQPLLNRIIEKFDCELWESPSSKNP
ncbi:MAG: DNA polymerase III subunit gamma/tau [Calditrichaeota bacterium]|nr:MAG: DNA polymerase III subunit gamma/tau [Calditrichota bacterium]